MKVDRAARNDVREVMPLCGNGENNEIKPYQ